MTTSVYLQQDLVREFVEAEDQERFRSVSDLVGSGIVSDLSSALEKARKAWSTVSNELERDAELAKNQVARLEVEFARLGEAAVPVEKLLTEEWRSWIAGLEAIGVDAQLPESPGPEDSPSSLDRVIRQVLQLREAPERRRDLASRLLADIDNQGPTEIIDEKALATSLAKARDAVGAGSKDLAEAQSRAAEARRESVGLKEKSEELRALARIALRHLEETCPICRQAYDQESTRRRLEEMLNAVPAREPEPIEVGEVAAELQRREEELARIEAEVRKTDETRRRRELWTSERDRRAAELQVTYQDEENLRKSLLSLVNDLDRRIAQIAEQNARGEHLALQLVRAKDASRKSEVEKQLNAARTRSAEIESGLKSRAQTGELATQLLEGLRAASDDVVSREVERLAPILDRIYARVDPHPSFRAISLLTRMMRGKGRLVARIGDERDDIWSETPEKLLSSSQLKRPCCVFFFLIFFAICFGLSLSIF